MTQSPAIYQVGDLLNEMRRLMEASYPEIWIEGECSSLSTPASGHLYFTLKDDSSQLRCAMFRNRAGINRYKPRAGDLVRVRAKISVYTARGDLQCIVQHIEEAGEGLLQRRFEELKSALYQQGLFDQAHKQVIPSLPKRIALITSPTGAAVNDVISTLKRRCPGIPIILYPAVVQGDTASSSLISAINDVVTHNCCDVILLSRGGGSMEDLWCFNDEGLAHAIYNCPIPIISGVGHEVDVTISDLVADLRAPTPTAAAEIVSPDREQLLSKLNSLVYRLPRVIERNLQRSAQNVDNLARQLVHPRQQLREKREKLLQASKQLSNKMRSKLSWHDTALSQQHRRFKAQQPDKKVRAELTNTHLLGQRLQRAQTTVLMLKEQRMNSIGEQLHTVSPLATLQRGFSITQDKDNKIVRSVSTVEVGSNVKIKLSDGELDCDITNIANVTE